MDKDAEHSDLTKSRGKSNKELLDNCRLQEKESAVLRHKEQVKGPGIIGKRGRKNRDAEDSDDDKAHALQAAKKRKDLEREKEMSQIMQKYLAPSKGIGSSSAGDDVDAPSLEEFLAKHR